MLASSSPKISARILRLTGLALAAVALFGACSDDDDSAGTAVAGSTGAGTAGTSSAGTSSAGRGGGQSQGGTSQGGQASAGESSASAGAGASSGGAGGEQSSGGSAGSDVGTGGAGFFDGCFDGLRAAEGNFQDGEKVSADSSYRLRIALETGDRFGTSGTMPWLPIRLALQTPGENLCLTDEVLLADSYTATHHNCDDVLTFTQGDREYTITTPDSTIDYNDPTTWMRPSMLTIVEGGDAIIGPIRLDTVECTSPDDPEQACRSGGPC